MASIGQNTLDVYYPQVLGSQGLDPVKVQDTISRIYNTLYNIQPVDPTAFSSIVTPGFIDQLLIALSVTMIIVTHEKFFATIGNVSWNAHQLDYKGIQYNIPAGSTTLKYIYWALSKPLAYQTSATAPVTSEDTYVIAVYTAATGKVVEVWQPRNFIGSGVTAGGTTTTNFVPKWSDGANLILTNSQIFDNGTDVGINTVSPLARLNVVGADNTLVGLFSGATKAVRFEPSSTGMMFEGVDNTGTGSYQPLFVGGSYVAITNSGSEAMRITGGEVGIGTITPNTILTVVGSGAGAAVIDIGEWVSAANVAAIYLNNQWATAGAYNLLAVNGGTDFWLNRPTGGHMYFLEGNGTAQMTIAPGGSVVVTNDLNSTTLSVGVGTPLTVDGSGNCAANSVNSNGYAAGGTPGITGTMTTATLVGKTLTFTDGLITGFA